MSVGVIVCPSLRPAVAAPVLLNISELSTTSSCRQVRDFQRGDHSGQHRKTHYRTRTTSTKNILNIIMKQKLSKKKFCFVYRKFSIFSCFFTFWVRFSCKSQNPFITLHNTIIKDSEIYNWNVPKMWKNKKILKIFDIQNKTFFLKVFVSW